MQEERGPKSVSVESQKKADKALQWLAKTLQRRLSQDGDFGYVAVEIKIQDGEIHGSMDFTDKYHVR